jgi:hypothetical protein
MIQIFRYFLKLIIDVIKKINNNIYTKTILVFYELNFFITWIILNIINVEWKPEGRKQVRCSSSGGWNVENAIYGIRKYEDVEKLHKKEKIECLV